MQKPCSKQHSKDLDLMLPLTLCLVKASLGKWGDLNEGGREADLGAEVEKAPPSL